MSDLEKQQKELSAFTEANLSNISTETLAWVKSLGPDSDKRLGKMLKIMNKFH